MKELWFAHYERLEAENPTATDDELCDMAEEAMIDGMADAADLAVDEAKYAGP